MSANGCASIPSKRICNRPAEMHRLIWQLRASEVDYFR